MKNNLNTLNELLPIFYTNKEKAEKYKKLAEEQNAEIKKIMGDEYLFENDEYRAVLSTATRVTMDENKLLDILKKNNINCIRTREYVDMDALENLIYHNDIPKDVLKLISKCKSEKETKSLRVTKK